MSTVLFTHSYFYPLDEKQWKFRQPYPPLGSLQAAAMVREAGFSVDFFDVALKNSPDTIDYALEKSNAKYLVIYDDGFNYLTKMCLTVMRDAALRMTHLAKEHGLSVIICSSDSTDRYEQYLDMGADFVVRGEGEESVKELLQNLESVNNPALVQGIAYRVDKRTALTPPRPVLRNLDALPMPAWDLIDLEPYREIWKKHHGYFSLNVATTRGCPYKCNWCAKPIYGNRYHSRSPEHVVNELTYLVQKFQPDHFWMCDDIFALKPGWLKQFAVLVAEKKLKFRYKIQSRVDLLQETDVVEALAASGTETVWVGAESGSQKILDAMEKGTTLAEIKKATALLQRHNVRVGFFLQFGYLGETKKDIEATLKMVLDQMPDEIGISISYPLPGTKFYEIVKDQLETKQNWSDSDDLAMMYRGTYSPAYYRLLHRYVHSRYRIKRGWEQLKQRKIRLRFLVSMIFHAPVSLVQGWRLNRLEHATA